MPIPDDVTFDPPTLDRWRRAIIAGFAVGGVSVAAWGPRLPALTAAFRISTGTVGLLLAGATAGGILGLVLSNAVLTRWGGRRAVAVALGTVGAGLAALGVAAATRSLPDLAVAFIVIGLAIGVLDVTVNVEGSANERAAGRTLLPRMHAAWSIGAAAGAGIGAACAALGISPAAQFLGEGAAVALTAIAIVPAIPGRGHVVNDGNGNGNGNVDDDRARWVEGLRRWVEGLRRWLAAWADPRLLMIGLVMLGCEIGEGSAGTWLTLGTERGHGLSAPVAALFFTVFAAAEALTRIFGGPAVDRLGRVTTVRVTAGMGVVGVALFILGAAPWVSLLGVLLWAVGVSMGFPLGMSAAAESGSNPALRVSVVATVGYAANLAGPPIIGSVAQSTGLLRALWIIAGALAGAALAAGSLRPRRPVHGSPSV